MNVVELEARHVRIPLRKPVKHASHTRESTDNLVVRCVLSDGTTGYGEGVPRDYVTGETIESAIALLKRSPLTSQLPACTNFEDAVRLAEHLHLAEIPGDERRCQGNATRCALELAILDAYGRCFGEPLMNVTKLVAPDLYRAQDQIQYSGMILSASGWKARFLSWGMRLFGFKQLKVKVGIPGHDDMLRLSTIRARVGKAMNLRVDANEAWSVESVVSRIQELEPYQITSVEQPVKHEDVEALASVRKQISTPIMLDESLCSEVDAERAQRLGLCDLFNIRLSKCGGLIPSLRLVEFARRHGLGYQLGCQVGETAILSAAGRHFATSVDGIRYLEGSYDRHLVRNWLSEDDITFRRGGWAPMLVGCGLGITIDDNKLNAVTIKRESILG